jgi:hypothetical protein
MYFSVSKRIALMLQYVCIDLITLLLEIKKSKKMRGAGGSAESCFLLSQSKEATKHALHISSIIVCGIVCLVIKVVQYQTHEV